MQNPFAQIEALLQKPAATGMFVDWIDDEGAHAKAGIAAGDIIIEAGGAPVTTYKEFYNAMRPKSPEDKTRDLTTLRGGKSSKNSAPTSVQGISTCFVVKGECAWEDKPDYAGEPDFSTLHDGAEYWLRNSFGDEVAGVQHNRITHTGGKIQIDIDFCLGGDGDHKWEYYTRAHSIHTMDKQFSVVKTAFWEGKPPQCKGDIRLDDDGLWRGVRRVGDKEVPFESRGIGPMVPAYPAMLLPMTMPLKKGASLTHVLSFDGHAESGGRARLECVGRAKAAVGGDEIDAWQFAWRHYGKRSESADEKIYVNDERQIVRVEWGDNYSNCWCELLPKSKALSGLPKALALAH